MEHLLLKAATTVATDEGTFEAVISTATVDREKDIVEPSAMVNALQKWVPTGKLMPLAWGHSTAAADQIGHMNPESVKAVGGEVVATGWIDQSTEVGGHAWRLVKSGTLGFSFGYMVLAATKRKGGGLHITELDVFEVSATPIPANGDTRVLSFKSAREEQMEKELQEVKARLDTVEHALKAAEEKAEEADKDPEGRSVDPLRRQADEVALKHASGGLSLEKPPTPVVKPRPELVELDELKRRMRDDMLIHLNGDIE